MNKAKSTAKTKLYIIVAVPLFLLVIWIYHMGSRGSFGGLVDSNIDGSKIENLEATAMEDLLEEHENSQVGMDENALDDASEVCLHMCIHVIV